MILVLLVLALTIFSGNISTASAPFTPEWGKVSGRKLPDVRFADADGAIVRLLDYKDKIIILHPMFTHCPSTCAFISSRISTAIKGLSNAERNNFEIVSFSFDPNETSENLAKFEKMFQIDRSVWKVVRADAAAVQKLLTALDYRTLQLGKSNYEHPNLIFIVGKDGILQDYIYGSDLTADRLAGILNSAEKNNSKMPALKLYLYVFALIGFLISTFFVATHLTNARRLSG